MKRSAESFYRRANWWLTVSIMMAGASLAGGAAVIGAAIAQNALLAVCAALAGVAIFYGSQRAMRVAGYWHCLARTHRDLESQQEKTR